MLWQPLTASILASVVTAAGIFTISRFREWSKGRSVYMMSFAAGILISVSFLHLIPKSFSMNSSSPGFLLAGFLGLYLVNRMMKMYFCEEYECEPYVTGMIPIIGIGLHSFIDGLIYVVTFKVDVLTGVLAAIGMVLHEFPEGIVSYSMLKSGGLSRGRSAVYAFIAAGLTTPLGVLLGYPFITKIGVPQLGLALAVSAGALVYAGASHLLPSIEKENRKFTVLTLAVGVLVAVAMVFFKNR
ncbi:MAG: ZIP family metal transporter [Candidatus Omnitrophica bacterium]|nr:ZIP family metal transporter [Candidatus Omnitrophota bacterium]